MTGQELIDLANDLLHKQEERLVESNKTSDQFYEDPMENSISRKIRRLRQTGLNKTPR